MEEMKLYSPLEFFLRDNENEDQYDDFHYWRDELSHEEAYAYIDEIQAALADERSRYDNGRGLMEYYGDGPLDAKIQSLVLQVELHGDRLWMVADVKLNAPLTAQDIAELKEYHTGQMSDGFGEGFEQRVIKVSAGDLYVEPWKSGRDFFVATDQEFARRFGFPHLAPDRPAPSEAEAALQSISDLIFSYRLQMREHNGYVGDNNNLLHLSDEQAQIALRYEIPIGMCSEYDDHHGSHKGEFNYTLVYSMEQIEQYRRGRMYEHAPSIYPYVPDPNKLLQCIHQIARLEETLAVEQEAVPDAEAPHMILSKHGEAGRILLHRLDRNADAMLNELQTEIGEIHLDAIHETAARIIAVHDAHEQLKTFSFSADELKTLLQLENPLEFVVDNWPDVLPSQSDMGPVFADILSRDPGNGYGRMVEHDTTPVDRHGGQKVSVRAQLRHATKEKKPPHRPGKQRLEPER